MMKYLKKFATNTDRSTYEEGDNYTEPYVSLVDNGGDLSYNHIFQLVDKEVYPYPNGKKKATVYYTRTFSSSQVNKYQPWCMPFDYTMSEEDKQNFQFYRIDHMTDSNIYQDQIYDKMLANTPYMIKPLNVGTYTFKAKNITLEKQINDEIICSFDSDSFINNFYQTYKQVYRSEIDTNYDVYVMSGGTFNRLTQSAFVPSYRWYFIRIPKS